MGALWYVVMLVLLSTSVFAECDWGLELLMDDTVFTDDFSFKIRAKKDFGDSANLSSSVFIQDQNGVVVKEYSPWKEDKATRQKTSNKYSPNLRPGFYLLDANLSVSCDTDQGNNRVQEIFTIQRDGFTESSLEILNVLDLGPDEEAEFGQLIRVRLGVYKGNTTRETVKLYIENGQRVSKVASVNFKEKFTDFESTIPLQIKFDCDDVYKDGRYRIVAEGLDAKIEETIKITHNEDVCPEQKLDKKFEYNLLEFPRTVFVNQTIPLKIQIENNDDSAHDFAVWSYVYRGSKVYSGEREENLKSVRIRKETIGETMLENLVSEPGEYKVKIKMLRDSLKTPHEVTKDITVLGMPDPILINVSSGTDPRKQQILMEPVIVYESASMKARDLVGHFFVSVLVLISGVVVWKGV